MICASCLEGQHDGHSVRALKKYLMGRIESQFEKPLFEGIVEYRENLIRYIDSRESKLADIKFQTEHIQKEIRSAQNQKTIIDEYYSKFVNKDTCGQHVNETKLLLRISELDFMKTKLYEQFDNLKGVLESVNKSSITTQKENADCRNGPSTDRNQASRFAFSTDPFARIDSSNTSETSSEGKVESECGSSDKETADCNCVLSHRPEIASNFTIGIKSFMNIVQRDPLVIRNNNYLHLCPFKFHVDAYLVNHKFRRTEKMFRVVVRANHLYQPNSFLPRTTFRYAFTLENYAGGNEKKTKAGVWMYPKFKQLYWYAITYSELLDQSNGWIDDEDDIFIKFELKL